MNYGPKGSPMTSKYRSRRLSNSTWHYVSVVVLSDGKIHTTVNSQQHTSTIVSYTIVKKTLYIIVIIVRLKLATYNRHPSSKALPS